MKKMISAALILALVLSLCACGGNQSGRENASTVEIETNTSPEPEDVSAEETKTYPAGMYKIGSDIPAGMYYLQAEGTTKAYFCISADSSGNSILENDNFGSHYFLEIEDGDYLELTRCVAIPIEEAEIEFDQNNLTEGMYRVGIDIPDGEYKLTQTSNLAAYVCVYEGCSKNRDIITNDNFENQKYITVKDGNYLLITRCEGTIVSEGQSESAPMIGLEELEYHLEKSMTSDALSCSVNATEETITVNLTVAGIDDAMENYWKVGKDLESWPSVKDATAQFNGNIKDFADSMKYEGMEIILNLVSEADETVIYATWVDGAETFDILNS